MTQTLEKVWNEVLALPEERQDIIAHVIIDEMLDENIWDRKFRDSADTLSVIAKNVRNDIKNGKILKKGFGEL